MMARKRGEIAAYAVILLSGVLLLVGTAGLTGSLHDAAVSIGATLVAAVPITFALRMFAGDPIESVLARIEGLEVLSLSAGKTGVLQTFGTRSEIPNHYFRARCSSARETVSLLGYAMAFLADDPEFFRLLGERSRAEGCCVRVLLGDTCGSAIEARNREEAAEGSIPSRIDTTLRRLANELGARHNVHVRVFDAPLYASIYAFDDEMVVCPALYGRRGSGAPALRLGSGQFFDSYERHFADLWNQARPVELARDDRTG